MIQQTTYHDLSIRYIPGRSAIGLAMTTAVTAGAVGLAALGAAVATLPDLDPAGLFAIAVVGGCVEVGRRAARQVRESRRIRIRFPAGVLRQRCYGDLTTTSRDEYRPLRPIGVTRGEAVLQAEALLQGLTDIPSVRIFRGIGVADSGRAVAAHAVSAGRLVIVVEPVAWPPGRYLMDATGQIRCDGRYIGQTVEPLTAAVRAIRGRLPWTHRVRALVTVIPTAHGEYALPAPTKEVTWILADELPTTMRTVLARCPRTVSRHVIATLTGVED